MILFEVGFGELAPDSSTSANLADCQVPKIRMAPSTEELTIFEAEVLRLVFTQATNLSSKTKHPC